MPFRPHRHTTLAAITALAFALAFTLAGSAQANGAPVVDTLTVTAANQNTLAVSWTRASNPGDFMYRLGYFEVDPAATVLFPGPMTYVYDNSPTTLSGAKPGTKYRVWVQMEAKNGATGNPVYRDVTTPPAGCARQDQPTTTTATWTRINPRTLRAVATVHGRTGATTPPTVAIQQYSVQGRKWVDVARGKSGTPQTITRPRGTFRAAFVGDCKLPALPSVSTAVTR